MNPRLEKILGGCGAALLAIGFAASVIDPSAWARAWLPAFVLISMIPIGSLGLLMVHGITGGRWGEEMAPTLVAAARTVPLLIPAFLPVLIFRGRLPDWPLAGAAPDVAHFYLNPFVFDLRSIVALLIWSTFAWGRIWRNQATAAMGLVVHLILVSIIPADWILTLPPGSTSTGFGLGFGIEQMLAALGFVALLATQGDNPRANRDLAGLMVTTLLAVVYFLYVQFLIEWYGDVPEKVKWFASRNMGAWPTIDLLAFLIGAAIPFLAILHYDVRRSPAAMRWVGLFVLLGVTLHLVWLTIPPEGIATLAPAIGVMSILMVFLLFTRRMSSDLQARGGA
jgi:hypothetical protein